MKKKKDLFDWIRKAEIELEESIEQFIKERGWEYSCDYPDHRWRWSKQFGIRTITACGDEAFEIECRIDNGIELETHLRTRSERQK